MENETLNLYITEDGFAIDKVNVDNLDSQSSALYELYNDNWSKFFLELCFIKDINDSLSVAFIQTISKDLLQRLIESEEVLHDEIPDFIYSDEEVKFIVQHTPFIIGREFVDKYWLKFMAQIFWQALRSAVKISGYELRDYLSDRGIEVTQPYRIYFHVVENDMPEPYPFAFLATYTMKTLKGVSHFPLKNIVSDKNIGEKEVYDILSVLLDVSNESSFVKNNLDNCDIFFPMEIDENDTYLFLKEIEIFERYGIICRIPKFYKEKNNKIYIETGSNDSHSKSYVNIDTLSEYVPKLIYNGVIITREEAEELLEKKEGLELINGKWIENKHDEVEALLKEYERYTGESTSLVDILRSNVGIGEEENDEPKKAVEVEFSRDDWFLGNANKQFSDNQDISIPRELRADLRPYQKEAYSWMWGMYKRDFGVCLADDMGLGKTIEVLAFLEKYWEEEPNKGVLIIVPATLVNNWVNEIERFAPNLDVFVLRGSNKPNNSRIRAFITITTYQTASRSDYIDRINWGVLILDEAQAIKNYYTDQTRKVKSLRAEMKIAMTGTPIENKVLELWSIFDFINPGLLGTRTEFLRIYSDDNESQSNIKKLIQPFVLRRVKTDKTIISDLPKKNEIDVTINMSKEQIVLYKKVVDAMNASLEEQISGNQRMLVMTAITRLKQICNHPSQYYGVDDYSDEKLSGKFIMLRNICETIYAKREKVLVFTQYKAIIPALDNLLASIFNERGATIDGSTSYEKRSRYVAEFQKGKYPYMILSLKTAGVGLTLTEAQNVIHFDRWWNPAVENQATDRAFRIGQKRDVTVYKFVTANTIEEVINTMLYDKKHLADEYINNLDKDITAKLSTEQLIKAIRYSGEIDG